ncbi:SDR family NAD(P)-dependent oxidoreductase [Pseudonocardia sp. KRD291]|uniref:SDR family NAD(P)-dependent oxidoreductase n=1 Tax=Pseudonocardia sp. KRD291 TaxID=2792007 RepID=UPI001C49E2FC|nr:SDR family oxidoreductase [Pseudonocardia sp. KRD291]MBW0101240.1 SDR family oxidoreductase [Pseudonocardia sp. KRD291]
MTNRLAGSIALVAGGASGMGAAAATLLSREGATVVVADRDDDRARALVTELPGRAEAFRLDVTALEACKRLAADLDQRYGRLKVLVNSAGIAPPGGAQRFDRTSVEDHLRLFDVHVHGTWYGMRAMVPLLAATGRSSIVNVSSIDGLAGVAGMAGYASAKFAVTGLTRATALELGPLGIRVNSVHPGVISTSMIATDDPAVRSRIAAITDRQPLARPGTADEVARMILFLASEDSAYCTGAQFVVDGGHLTGPVREPLA